MEGSGNRAFLIALHKGNLSHLAREGLATMFIGLGYCPSTGYNPGLLPASLLDITRWEDISTLWGWYNSPLCRMCGAQQETSAHIFCDCDVLVTLRHTYLGSFFLDPEDVRNLSLGAKWNFIKGTGFLWLGHQLKGYKGHIKKAYVHRDWKGSNPFIISFYSILFYSTLLGQRLEDIAGAPAASQVAPDSITKLEFQRYFQQWETRKNHCINSEKNYFKRDNTGL